jgi:hypothetical protein
MLQSGGSPSWRLKGALVLTAVIDMGSVLRVLGDDAALTAAVTAPTGAQST